jgi:nucleoporin NDC1
MWKAHLGFAKLIFNLQRSNARAMGLPPIFGTMHVTIFTGFFIGFTWEVCSLLFIVYLRKEPIKKDLPLSAASKDPNGTLLNGLKAKRDIVKTYAFWELAIIAQGNPDRRKAIFTDIERPAGPAEVKKTTTITEIERPKGPIWAQMLEQALKVLKQADDRISPPESAPIKPHEKMPDIENLPKILPMAKTRDIFASPTPAQSARMKIAGVLREEAGKLMSSPEPWRPQLDKAVKMIEDSQLADARSAISREVRQSPAAWFFRSTNAARINATVLGSPYSNAAILVDAIEAVTRMLVASLQEDLYGNAIKGVPATVKQFTTSITLIETLIKANPPGKGDIGEVEIVLGRLKAGLRELLAAFQTFLNDTALGIGELNAAKSASGQTSTESQEEKSTLQLKDAPLPSGGNADRQDDVRRSWGKQPARTDHPRLQSGEAPARLFARQEPAPRKTSREMNGGGRTIRVPPRRREMEQVR